MTPRAPGEPVQLCFVCLGNICRSPTAEGIMAALIAEAGLADRIVVDSAGTGAWHVGNPADERSAHEARARGVHLTSRARQFHPGDLSYFELVLAMDRSNLAHLRDLAPEAALRDKIHLLRAFDPASATHGDDDLDVPDPYYGGPTGFADVYDLIDAACRGLLTHVRATYEL